MTPGSADISDDVVAGFFEAAVGLRSWNAALGLLADRLGVRQFSLAVVDRRTTRLRDVITAGDEDTPLKLATGLPERRDQATLDALSAPAASSPTALGGSLAQTVVQDDDGLTIGCAILRDAAQGEDPRMRRLFQRYMRHLATALKVQATLAGLVPLHAMTGHWIHHADQPMLVLGAGGDIQMLNEAGRRLLEKDEWFVDQDGALKGRTRRGDEALRSALCELLAARSPRIGVRSRPPIRRALRMPGLNRRPLLCTLWDVEASAPTQTARPVHGDRVLLAAPAPDAVPHADPAVIRALFGLTPAESRICIALMNGADAAAIARSRALSINTIRAQLRAIMIKTGTRRQPDLIRLLWHATMVWPAVQLPCASTFDERRA
ncbi:MAG: hypothetical protein QM766_09065 [Burkholderiaceae bacterium]